MSSPEELKTSVYEDDGTSPAGWVVSNPSEQDIIEILSNVRDLAEYGLNTDYLDERAQEHGMYEWRWEEFQKFYFSVNGWYITNKARQTGGSLSWAVKKLLIASLSPGDYTAVATSITKTEAQNKIQYVRQFIEALPPRFKKKIIRDAVHLIEFENPNKTRSRIISHAQKPLRGVHGDVGFDELAFYQKAREIYESALPVVSQVNGHIDVISTPFGLGDMFSEIFLNKEKYPSFTRMPVMWWHCRRWLKDPSDKGLLEAFTKAPRMEVYERVFAFGNPSLIEQYRNLDEIIFKQEFEGFFVDELASFFHKELILRCFVNIDDSEIDEYQPVEKDFDISIESALEKKASVIERLYDGVRTIDGKKIHFKKYDHLHELYAAVASGEIGFRLFGGADVGTTFHAADFVIFEEVILPNFSTLQIERFRLNKQNWKLPDQQEYYMNLLNSGYILKLGIDSTGLGVQMAQFLEKQFPQSFKGFHMGGNAKMPNLLMTNMKTRMESGQMALQNSKQTLEDLYSIRRVVGETKTISYRADEKKRHHADAAWSTAIASYMGTHANDSPSQLPSSDNLSRKSPPRQVEMQSDGTPRLNPRIIESHFSKLNGTASEGVSSQSFSNKMTSHMPKNGFNKNYDK